MVWKARVINDPLQLDSNETGVRFQLLHDDPPVLSFPHKHRHPTVGMMGQTILLFSKAGNLLRVTFKGKSNEIFYLRIFHRWTSPKPLTRYLRFFQFSFEFEEIFAIFY
jgi:hypothetical protein